MPFIGHDDYHRGRRNVRTARSMNFGDVKLGLDPEFVLLLNGLLREALIQQPSNENTAQFCLNYVNGLLNKRSDNTKLVLADLVGIGDDEYKLMFESIESEPEHPNQKPKIRPKKQNLVKNTRNQEQKSKNRNRPQTGRLKTGQKSKNSSPRNKIVRLDSPYPNQDIVSSPEKTPRSPDGGSLGTGLNPNEQDHSHDPGEEMDNNHTAPISWIDDVLEPSRIENPNVECPLDVDTEEVTVQEAREPSQQGNVDFLDENIIRVASKLSNELLQAVTIEEHEDNVLNTGFNAGNTNSHTGSTNYSSRVECREVKGQATPAPKSIPPSKEVIDNNSSNVSSNLTSKMTSKSSIQSQKSNRNQSANDIITGSTETNIESSSKPGNSKNGNKKRVSKKTKRKKNSRSSMHSQRSNSELESIHEDIHLETPSSTLETVVEGSRNVKNQPSSSRSTHQPSNIEHSESRDHVHALPRLPPGPMAEEDIESEERFSRMEQAGLTIDRVTMSSQQAGPFPRFQTLPGAIKRRSLEFIEQASKLFSSSSEKIIREEASIASSTSSEKMTKSKSRNSKGRNKSNVQINKTRSRHSKESLDSTSTLASNSSRFLKRKRSVTSSISNRSQKSQKSQNIKPLHSEQSESRGSRTSQKRFETVHSSSHQSNERTTPYYNQEPDETDELTENDDIGKNIVSQSQHGQNYPPAVLSSTSVDSIDNSNIKESVNKQYSGTTTKWTSDGSSGYDPEAGSQSLSNVNLQLNRTERNSFVKKKTSQDRNISGKLLSNRTSKSNNSIQENKDRPATGSSSHRSNQLQSASSSLSTYNRQLETYNKKDQIIDAIEEKTLISTGPSALTVSLLCLTSCAVGAGIAFAFCKYKLKMFKS